MSTCLYFCIYTCIMEIMRDPQDAEALRVASRSSRPFLEGWECPFLSRRGGHDPLLPPDGDTMSDEQSVQARSRNELVPLHLLYRIIKRGFIDNHDQMPRCPCISFANFSFYFYDYFLKMTNQAIFRSSMLLCLVGRSISDTDGYGDSSTREVHKKQEDRHLQPERKRFSSQQRNGGLTAVQVVISR